MLKTTPGVEKGEQLGLDVFTDTGNYTFDPVCQTLISAHLSSCATGFDHPTVPVIWSYGPPGATAPSCLRPSQGCHISVVQYDGGAKAQHHWVGFLR